MLHCDVRERGKEKIKTLGTDGSTAVGEGQEGTEEYARRWSWPLHCFFFFLERLMQEQAWNDGSAIVGSTGFCKL